ncbi:MAG: FtsX-like permease family protein [Candidatus Odinarchaeota archaeon]
MPRILNQSVDLAILSFDFINSNKKPLLVSFTGLILALAIIVNGTMIVDSYRNRVFSEYIFNNDLEPDITVWSKIDTSSPEELATIRDFLPYSQIINRSLENINYKDYLIKQHWFSSYKTGIWITQTGQDYQGSEKTLEFPLRAPDAEFFDKIADYLLPGSRLPENSSEIILVVRGSVTSTDFRIGSELNITSHSYSNSYTNNNVTVKIVGLLETPDRGISGYTYRYLSNTPLTELEKLIWKFCSTQFEYQSRHGIILTTADRAADIAGKIVRLDEPHDVFESELRANIFLDHEKFDGFSMPTAIEKLEKLVLDIEEQLVSITGKYPYVGDQLIVYLQTYEGVVFSLIVFLLLFSAPVLSIALYLVSYSFGLIKRQKRAKIGIIKTRGASTIQVLVIMSTELILTSLLTIALAVVLGYLLTNLVLRSTDFLVFTGENLPIVIPPVLLRDLLLVGVMVAMLVNIAGNVRLSTMNINESIEPVDQKLPVWKRFYLDALSTGLGLFGFYLFHILARTASYNPLLDMLLLFLGIPAPFLLFFGSVLLLTRAVPHVIAALSRLFWRLENGLVAFAFRNIMRHQQAVNRAIILVTLALSFSLITSSMIFSVDETTRINLYYSAGADLNVNNGLAFNETVYSILAENTSNIARITRTIKAEIGASGSLSQRITFLFVDPETYAETAFFSTGCKISNKLPVLLDRIADNKSVVMLKKNVESQNNLTTGKKFVMLLSNGTSSESVPLNVVGTFTCWPQLYSYTRDPLREYFCIGSLGLYKYLNSSDYLITRSCNYLIKLETSSDVRTTVELVKNQTGVIPEAPGIAFENYKSDFNRGFFLTILNSDILISIAVAVTGIVMFAFFIYIERGKEIGVERTLGMTRFQTGLLFTIEGLTILLFGIVMGTSTGLALTSVFLSVIRVEQVIPPIVVAYPLDFFIKFLVGVITAAVVGSLIPAYLSTKRDISRILKIE